MGKTIGFGRLIFPEKKGRDFSIEREDRE